jgi:hypothetical protein
MSESATKSPRHSLEEETRTEYDFRGGTRGKFAERFRHGALVIGDIEFASRKKPPVGESEVSDWVWVDILEATRGATTIARYHSSKDGSWWEERDTGRRLSERVLHWAPIRGFLS